MLKWYEQTATHQEIVISSRIRIVRNLEGYPFSPNLSDDDSNELVEKVKTLLPKLKEFDLNRKYYGCDLKLLSDLDKNAMIDKHIIRPVFAMKKQRTGFVMSEDEAVGIMVNEEDHIRIQVTHAGLNLVAAYEEANALDDFLYDHLKFAYNEKFGYLSTSPANVGTGLRASVLVFLPALAKNQKIGTLIEEVAKYGVTMKEIYGDGKYTTALYEVSNQKTLGYTEAELIENINRMVLQIMRQEKKRREYMLSSKYDEIEDQLYRSFGTLKYAKSISSKEAMSLLSDVKYGLDMGILKTNHSKNIYQLMLSIRPSVVQWKLEKAVGKAMRDKIRAEYIHTHLPCLEEV